MLHEAGEPERAEAVWGEAVAAFERGPKTERFASARDVHQALFDLCRGDPTTADALLAAHPDSNPAALLRAWAEPRR